MLPQIISHTHTHTHTHFLQSLHACLLTGSSVLYTTSCKHSLVLLRMDEIVARNMLSLLKLLIKLFFLYLVGCLYYSFILSWNSKLEGSSRVKIVCINCSYWLPSHQKYMVSRAFLASHTYVQSKLGGCSSHRMSS